MSRHPEFYSAIARKGKGAPGFRQAANLTRAHRHVLVPQSPAPELLAVAENCEEERLQDGTQVEEGQVTATSSTPPPDSSTSSTAPPSTSTTYEASQPPSTLSALTPTPTPALTTSTPASTTTPTPIGLPIAKVTLTRPQAKVAHAGVYTCMNSCTPPVNLTLHVLIGDEETAAMQHLSGSLSLAPAGGASGLLLVAAVTSWRWHKMAS
ncbi:integumentary mucin C.1-like [Cherax quadricarinatus]|uniref:integumentary mucin C.1-like n=1 Tax=Cherax quadricarinatus TaxID=27406 RepID=UPI00387E87CC